ncbi:MAG: hypothetical protein HKN45_10870 [Flavobacteriales bacterium]|nr:hypothetical protein [Flavobacteriales bacterium]
MVYRNKQEVVYSIVKRTELSKMKLAKREYVRAYELISLLKDRAPEVHFSDLVNDPVSSLKGVCRFLDLQLEEKIF